MGDSISRNECKSGDASKWEVKCLKEYVASDFGLKAWFSKSARSIWQGIDIDILGTMRCDSETLKETYWWSIKNEIREPGELEIIRWVERGIIKTTSAWRYLVVAKRKGRVRETAFRSGFGS